MDSRDLEGVARDALESIGLGDALPVRVRTVARAHGLTVQPFNGGRGAIAERIIAYNDRDTPQRQRYAIAHELAHHVLREAGEQDSERACQYVAGAMLMPERPAKALLRGARCDLAALVDAANVSWEAAGRRYVQLFSAVVTVFDHGSITRREQSPWAQRWFGRVTPLERELERRARDAREHVYESGTIAAYYVEGPTGWQRVITVAGLDELAERR